MWIALTAPPAKLRRVRRRLRQQGHQAYIPAICRRRTVMRARHLKRQRHIALLMSYVLVEVPDARVADLWLYQVLATKDVRGYLKSGDGPAMILDYEIAELRREVIAIRQKIEAAGHKAWLRSGAKASIKAGAAAGQTGTIQTIKGHRVRIEARFLGSHRVIETTLDNLEAA